LVVRALAGTSVLAVVSLLALAPPAATEENIYAPDLRAAERGLQRAENRLAAATAELQDADSQLPSAEVETARLEGLALAAERRADRVLDRVEDREDAVDDRRYAALAEVDVARASQARQTVRWENDRAYWVALAAVLAALAGGLLLAVYLAALPKSDTSLNTSAVLAALALGASVTLVLGGLVVALYVAETDGFSWWPVGAAAICTVSLALGAAIGWKRRAPLPTVGAFAVRALAFAIAVSVAIPVAISSGLERPRMEPLTATTLRLAELADSEAEMPAPLRAARRRAERLGDQANRVRRQADGAFHRQTELEDQRAHALGEQEVAHHAVARRSDALARVQADYASYEELLKPLGPDGYDEFSYPELETYPELPDFPSYADPPDLPSYPDLPDVDSSYPPTTEDFGSGLGRIGLCNDGTLSDSIGRPGACSHHGGVR
jgi:VIT1/CCC1 family predicted Fe2+/Mn2+ transporter